MSKKNNIDALVVGGTGFLGGAIVEALINGGHSVAVLSRGSTLRELPDRVELIRADRHGDLSALKSRSFKWLFDTCAFTPDAVSTLLDALDNKLDRYIFASSLSTYGRYDSPGITEATEVPDATQNDFDRAADVPISDRGSATAYGPSYGPLKRACERVAERRMGDRATVLRLGLIVGKGDYTDRLTWWVRRIDEAGHSKDRTIPAPLPKDRPVQILDVRDAAEFAVLCAKDNLGGIWNVNGEVMPLRDLLEAISNVTSSTGDVRWVPPDAFSAAEVSPWTDVPLMVPDIPAFRHFLEVDASRARAAGLKARMLMETLQPLITWDRARRDLGLKCGMSNEQEERVIAASR